MNISRKVIPMIWILLLALAAPVALAQSQPVQISISGNTATATIGAPLQPIAEVILEFENASGLTPASLGLSADLVSISDPALLARLPDPQLNQLAGAFPLLVTIEPPSTGGLKFRTVRVQIHTHALVYSIGSAYRLFKAPLNGNFTDITDEIAQGSIRANGTTGGFSQFLVLTDLRETVAVVAEKLLALRDRVDTLPTAEQAWFDARLDAVEAGLAAADYDKAIADTRLIALRARARAAAGAIGDEWRASRDVQNPAGDLIAGAASLEFSIAYLRDFGQ
ncbi:MAG: DUF6689 family protein [Pseudomonadota bacterium]